MSKDIIRKAAFVLAERKRTPILDEVDQMLFEADILEALRSVRDVLNEERGDPRGYGQGFYDPLGSKIAALDEILRSN